MASNNNSNNIDITYATMGEVMDYHTSSPTGSTSMLAGTVAFLQLA